MTKNERINELMLSDISEKGIRGAVVFIIFGVFVFLHGLGIQKFLTEIRIACVCVIIANILRIFTHMKGHKDLRMFWLRLTTAVWLNAAGWSAVFSLVAVEHDFQGINSVIAFVIMSHFVTASILTLSWGKYLFFPFHLIVFGPVLTVALLRSFDDSSYLVFAGLLLFMLVLVLGLSMEYKRLYFKRFATQLELEDSLLLLKEQTAQLVQTSKLAALGEMAGGMAHEINNPLAIISLLSKRIQGLLKKEPAEIPEARKFLGEIEETVVRISRIIRGLRNVSRGADDEELREVRISEIFDDVFGICSEKFRMSHVLLELKDEKQLHHSLIRCQRVQLSQVLINLISNGFDAVKSLPDEKWVRVSLDSDQNSLLIAVSNSGPLIPAEVRKKLFQPFFTTKEIGKGTGLGLSISKKIAEAHGGEIFLDQNSAHTAFVVRLPLITSRVPAGA